MGEKIGIGIIGTGFARKIQIPAFSEIAGAEIVSVASGQLENARSTAGEFGIGHFTDNWRETVSREDVDLVCITTPPDTHFEIALAAIEFGKHILCEKPMAMDARQAQEMTTRAAEKGLLALIDHELRFTNGRLKARQLLLDGKIGKIIHAKYFFNNASRGDADKPWTWWSDSEQGGGALGAIGSHVIDSLQWFLGAEVSEIYCRLHTHIKERPDIKTGIMRNVTSDDETLLVMKFAESELTRDADGIASLSVVEAGPYRNAVELFGTRGALRIEDGGEIFFAAIKENDWHEIEVETTRVAPNMPDTGWSRGFMNFSREIITALLKEKKVVENAATFAVGLQIQIVLDAARESNANGCAVKI